MDEFSCPKCGTSKYQKPSLKLFVNECGHSLCDKCLDTIFLYDSANCPQCGRSLRRKNFRLRLFEDDLVEKEIDVRRKILRDFNKKEEDFETTADYDNYLEQIETIIYNLTNGVDVEETEQLVENYKKANAEAIAKNRSKLSKDELLIEQLLEDEKEREQLRKQWHMQDESNQQFARMKKRQKEALVDKLLLSSDLSATEILEDHVKDLKLVGAFLILLWVLRVPICHSIGLTDHW